MPRTARVAALAALMMVVLTNTAEAAASKLSFSCVRAMGGASVSCGWSGSPGESFLPMR